VENGQVDLEAEMTSLADEQLRYDATTKLLQKTYEQLRLSVRDK
jgi:flagellar basal body rod protein FlgB